MLTVRKQQIGKRIWLLILLLLLTVGGVLILSHDGQPQSVPQSEPQTDSPQGPRPDCPEAHRLRYMDDMRRGYWRSIHYGTAEEVEYYRLRLVEIWQNESIQGMPSQADPVLMANFIRQLLKECHGS
ncbi:MAG: hypothetical protein KF770_14415 [Anaerolineae bacterium]|nr:hypothetical protein [Anaerolineae bacterium]